MSICGIYAIENFVNGKVYIGQSIDIERRFNDHKTCLESGNHYNYYLQRSWNKYGKDSFIFKIIESCLEKELNEKEIFYISKFRKITKVYNMCNGGSSNSGYVFTEEIRIKMSESHKGITHNVSKEAREKISRANKGRVISDEHKKRISEANKGKIGWYNGKSMPEKIKNKISNTLKGRPSPNKGKTTSGATKIKLSNALKGRKPWNKGKSPSVETIEKLREAMKHRNFSEEKKIEISKKISMANKGRVHTEEAKRKMSEKRKGKNLSEEHKKNIGNSVRGIKRSDESKKRYSEAAKKREALKKEKLKNN